MSKPEFEMTSFKETNLHSPLIREALDSPAQTPDHHLHSAHIAPDEEPYCESGSEPKIPLKHLPLVVLPGLLISGNIRLAEAMAIPSLQYLFLTVLFSFLLNYYLLRKY